MNIEALEKDDLYCSVRETNGKVRVLEKEKSDCSFKEILDLENKIEDASDTIELLYYNIQNLDKKNNDKKWVYLIQLFFMVLLPILFPHQAFINMLFYCCILEAINIVTTGFIPLNNKRKRLLLEEKQSFIEEKEELEKKLNTIKESVKVKEFVAIDSEIPYKDVNRILALAYHDRPIGDVYNLYSLKVLRYELLRYIRRKKQMDALENNISEIDVEYPGIPKVLKKNRE